MSKPDEESELPNGGGGPEPEPEPEPEPVSSNADPKLDDGDSDTKTIQPNEPQTSSHAEKTATPELRSDEVNRSFTMRELLNELKEGEGGKASDGEFRQSEDGSAIERRGSSSPYSKESTQQQQQHKDQKNVAMDLINRVAGVDEEGRSRQRILTFAAGRYASAIERNPEDYDALYNWALVLQESADNVDPDSSSSSKDALLEEACKKYDEATRHCPTLHDSRLFYNWAIAISDRAKMRGRTKEAEELWKQATKNYERAVQLNWNSPQALNNWGLALQELSAIVQTREKEAIVRSAISKFRAAIRLQFDFHRAIYNLGTVLYGLAEDTLRTGGSASIKDPNELYSQSAIYIAAAHALKPNYSVYHSALKLVRSMLPLPYLKVGYLTAPPATDPVAPHSDWKRSQFVLNHEGLQQLNKIEKKLMLQNQYSKSGEAASTDRMAIKVDIPDIVSVSACADLTLPAGAGLCIDTIHGPIFLIADSWESLDGWLDAIRLVYTIFARGKSDVLAGIITG